MNNNELVYGVKTNEVRDMNSINEVIKQNRREFLAVSEFLIDFYNEYRKDDRVGKGQQKVLKRELGKRASIVAKTMFPSMHETYEKKTDFYKEWYKVVRAFWSIYCHRVNDNECGYSETPKVKFDSAVKFIKTLTIADYDAYRDFRWADIHDYEFEASMEAAITVERLVEKYNDKQLMQECNVGLLQ